MRDDVFRIGRIKPGMGNDRSGHAVRCRDLFKPERFTDLVGALAFGLAVHSGDDVVPSGISTVVVREVITPQGRIIAQEKVGFRLAFQEWIMALIKIPQMMVSINDLKIFSHCGIFERLTM